jgi:predicted RND superfamily exporter protein
VWHSVLLRRQGIWVICIPTAAHLVLAYGAPQTFCCPRADIYATFNDDEAGQFEITFGGDVITDWEIRETLLHDARFVLLSIAIAVVTLALATRSLALTVFGILQVLLSFPIAYSFYYLGGHRDLTVISFLSPFVILGIGLDDIFVFVGVYQSLRFYKHRFPLTKRLSVAWHRASGSMLATSATSAASFAANVISPIPAVRMHLNQLFMDSALPSLPGVGCPLTL